MRIILTFIAIISTIPVDAQINHFSDESSQWFVKKVKENGNFENPFHVDTTTLIYGFQGDTLIDSGLWLKMYSSSDPEFLNSLEFEGYVKSSNSVVEFLSPNLELDTLYDFNLMVSDSVFYDFQFQQHYLNVLEIDNEVIDGNSHSVFIFSDPALGPQYIAESWIYGIGSLHGPLYPISAEIFESEAPDQLDVVCTHVSDNSYYISNSSQPCFESNIVTVDEIERNNINLNYNNTNSTLKIESENIISRINIYSITGNILKTESCNSNVSTQNLSHFGVNIFILELVINGNKRTFKFIKT